MKKAWIAASPARRVKSRNREWIIGILALSLLGSTASPVNTDFPASLGSDHFLYDLDFSLIAKGLQSGQIYTIRGVMPHATDASRVFYMQLDAIADGNGEIDIGKVLTERTLGRTLTNAEELYAGTLALKAMDDVSSSQVANMADMIATLPQPSSNDCSLLLKVTQKGSNQTFFYKQGIAKIDPGIQVVPFNSATDGLDGAVFRSRLPGKRPTVIYFGGSTGTANVQWSNFLAHNGYNVIALRYFSYAPKDPSVVNHTLSYLIDRTPLSIVSKAVEYARRQDYVDGAKISLFGESRGGEYVAVVAQHLGNQLGIGHVIASRSQGFVVGSAANAMWYPGPPEHSSWLLPDGTERPFAPYPSEYGNQVAAALAIEKKAGTLTATNMFGLAIPTLKLKPGFDVIAPPPQSFIDLSGFHGTVTAIAGGDDAMWRSVEAVKQFQKQRIGHAGDQFIIVEGAGHVTYPGITPDALSAEYGTLFSTAMPPTQASIDAGNTIYALSGGKQLPNAVYSVLDQASILATLSDDPMPAHLFPDFMQITLSSNVHQNRALSSLKKR